MNLRVLYLSNAIHILTNSCERVRKNKQKFLRRLQRVYHTVVFPDLKIYFILSCNPSVQNRYNDAANMDRAKTMQQNIDRSKKLRIDASDAEKERRSSY